MPSRTEVEKEQIRVIREKLNDVEQETKDCTWMSQEDKDSILKSMVWTRDHINRGKTEPSIQQIYDNLYSLGMDSLDIDKMILELQMKYPSDEFYETQLSKQITSLVGGMKDWEPSSKQKIMNFNLADSHPDKTDQYGNPYYMPSDDNGFPLDFDPKKLSYTEGAQKARLNYGALGSLIDNVGEKVPRFERPTPTKEARREQEKQFTKFNNVPDSEALDKHTTDLHTWYETVYIPEQIHNMKESLEQQEKNHKQGIKDGSIPHNTPFGPNIKWVLSEKKNQLEGYLKSGLQQYAGKYEQWKAKQ